MTPKSALKSVTQAEFSRHRGVSRKTVTQWKAKGLLVYTSDGKIDVAATDALLSDRPDRIKGGTTTQRPDGKAPKIAHLGRQNPVPLGGIEATIRDASPEALAQILGWTHAEASRVKEVYLALLRRQEFEVNQEKLVEIEDVARQVEQEYSVVKERMLAIPGKVAAKLVGQDRDAIEIALSEEINEALNELHDPDQVDGRGDNAGGEAEEGEEGS